MTDQEIARDSKFALSSIYKYVSELEARTGMTRVSLAILAERVGGFPDPPVDPIPLQHSRSGNCCAWGQVFACSECRDSICDVCHPHDEPRGSCSRCTPCTPCASPHALEGLTVREYEVLREIHVGRTNDEIAGSLDLAPDYISQVVSSLYRKTGIKSRVRLALLAERSRIL